MPTNLTNTRFPACLVRFPDETAGRSAAFFLAAEEYVAQTFAADNYLFSWVLRPTIVMGRNQVAEHEADLDFCHRESIEVVRRKSGGGCIYADENNIMFSLVTTEGAVEPIFEEYARVVAAALTDIGAVAHVSGRNDILLESGTKVCGNAFYHLAHRNIVHGTMLYDTDFRRMTGALTPPQQKLEAHADGRRGVKSVRSRVGLIKDVCPIGVEALRRGIESRLCNRERTLTATDLRAIDELERPYHDAHYIYGTAPSNLPRSGEAQVTARTNCGQRIEGVGTMAVHFTVEAERIADVTLTGDFFALVPDAEAAFRKAFVGLPLTPDALREAIAAHHPEQAIRGLTDAALLKLIQQTDNL